MQLLFNGGYYVFPLPHDPCSDYSRVATIRSATFIQGNTVYACSPQSIVSRVAYRKCGGGGKLSFQNEGGERSRGGA